MDYPGRYSRWHLGLRRPLPGDRRQGPPISARALNDARQGRAARRRLLPAGRGQARRRADRRLFEVHVPESADLLTEEMRSRRPTVFTAIREVIAAFRGDDPHLGLYGSFGYDLAFQFEPIRQELVRPGRPARPGAAPARPAGGDRPPARDQRRIPLRVHRRRRHHRGLARTGDPCPSPSPPRCPPTPSRATTPRSWPPAKEKFKRGDLFEVVARPGLPRPLHRPVGVLPRLRHSNPARTSSSSTSARASTWSAPRPRCTSG